MFRTRDFVLLFVTIVFLVTAISATALKSSFREVSPVEQIKFVDTGENERGAETYTRETLSREGKLADMRKKIAESGVLTISAPEIEEDTEVTIVEPEEETNLPILLTCPNYRNYSGYWSTDGIKTEVSEGARIFFRESIASPVSVSTTSDSASLPPEINKEIIAQLPLYPTPSPAVNCISTDVIGIAQDGSLIRNNEAGLYSVFGHQTLIGYALDGYPIYGANQSSSDSCGGESANGQYGYYLSDNRDTILNCYKAKPISL